MKRSAPEDAWLTAPKIHHAQVMCGAISDWQRKRSESSYSIDWVEISRIMKFKKIQMSPTECHLLWKYLAYGKTIANQNDNSVNQNGSLDETDEVGIDSDEEDFILEPQVASLAYMAKRDANILPLKHEDLLEGQALTSRSCPINETLCAMVMQSATKEQPSFSLSSKTSTVNSPSAAVSPTAMEALTHVCLYCNKKFASKNGLRYHLKKKHATEIGYVPEKTVKCEHCSRLLTERNIKKHVARTHPNIDSEPNQSDRPQKNSKDRAETEGLRVPKNKFCKDNVDASNMAAHMKERHSDTCKPPKCPSFTVVQSATNKDNSKRVILNSGGLETSNKKLAKRVKCDLCTKSFDRLNELSRHIKKEHSKDQKPLVNCIFCQADVRDYLMMDHIKKMHPEQLHKCPYCARKFAFERFIAWHIKSSHPVHFLMNELLDRVEQISG